MLLREDKQASNEWTTSVFGYHIVYMNFFVHFIIKVQKTKIKFSFKVKILYFLKVPKVCDRKLF